MEKLHDEEGRNFSHADSHKENVAPRTIIG
jgi:hypothetical protein